MSRTISTILSMRDNMSGGIMRVSRNVQGMTSQMRRASQQSAAFANNAKKQFEKIGDKTLKLGAVMAGLAAGFVIKVGFEGMKELDEASAKVKSIAGASLDKKVIKKGLLKTSSDTGIGTTELGDTQYNAISSGVSSQESLEAAVTSAKLAKAGFTDSNSALKVLTATMNVYGLKGQAAMRSISDKMLITQNLGVTTVAELSESMGSLTPIASSAGLSIDELMSSMVGLTKNGIKTDEAVTEMKGIMTSIISPTKESADMAKKLGIDFSAAGLKSMGFVKFMEEIKKKTGGSTEKMAGLFGNVRALTGALVLGGGGFKDMAGAMDAMKDSAGATDEAFAVMNDTLGNKLNKLKNRMNNIATSIMDSQSSKMGKMVSKITDKLALLESNGSIQKFVDKISEGVSKIIEVISKVFNFLRNNKKTIENIALTFASFYVAIKIMKILKGVIFGVQIAMSLLSGALVMTPFGWVMIAITAIIVGFVLLYKNSAKFREGVAILIVKLKEFGSSIMSKVKPILANLSELIKTKVIPAIKDIAKWIQTNVIPGFIKLCSFIKTSVVPVFMQLWSFIQTNVIPVFMKIAGIIVGMLVQAFNTIIPLIKSFYTNIIVPLANFLATVIPPIFAIIVAAVMFLWKNVLLPLALFLVNVFQAAFTVVLPFISSIFSNVFETIGGIIGGMTKIFSGLIDFVTGVFTGNWSKAWDGIKEVFSGVFENIKAIASGVVNSIINGINLVIRSANKISSIGGIFGDGLNIPEIPEFAKGTTNAPGGLSLVGEKGPEFVNLRKGDTVTTADKTSKMFAMSRKLIEKGTNSINPINKKSIINNIENNTIVKDTSKNTINKNETENNKKTTARSSDNKPFIINMYGTTIREKADIDEVATELAKKLKGTAPNLG